jgi:hypothetical protein
MAGACLISVAAARTLAEKINSADGMAGAGAKSSKIAFRQFLQFDH